MMDAEIRKAEVILYKKFLGISKSWPGVLWKTSKIDKTNPCIDLKDFILQYISNTIESPVFNGSVILKHASHDISNEELIKIYAGASYVSEKCENRQFAMTGDLFMLEETKFLINIRPLCDLLRDKNRILYCLQGSVINDFEVSDQLPGQIIQRVSHEIVPYIANNKAICFDFKELVVKEWDALKEQLVGRLLPPYSLHIQQRYSQYLHRIGLPRIPDGYFEIKEQKELSC